MEAALRPDVKLMTLHSSVLWELMDAVDSYITMPKRDADRPFLMPIEDVFSITGRGTLEQVALSVVRAKVGDDVEVVGSRYA